MNNEKFIGTWKLKSFEIKKRNKETIYPYGTNPIGYIIYSKDGYMSVLITDQHREKFKAEAFATLLAYCGKYEVKNGEIIIHHLEACSIPDWVGTSQERKYKFAENALTLSAITADSTATLVWERV